MEGSLYRWEHIQFVSAANVTAFPPAAKLSFVNRTIVQPNQLDMMDDRRTWVSSPGQTSGAD